MTVTPPPTDFDQRHMRAALVLARRGLGNTWPNPAVGCVLVRDDLDGRIVGRGWTQSGGRPHAETEALRQAGDLAHGATAYVTLEPCNHTGQTGPCSEALIDAGISRVVAACVDPDPRVAGAGLKRLRDAGVAVLSGVLEAEAQRLNEGFFLNQQAGRPAVTMKLATTLDGKIASRTGHSQWITGTLSRQRGHLLRATHDAILTGIGTALADDPSLTCRLPGLEHRSPVRIVLDSQARLPVESNIAITANATPVWRYAVTGTASDLGHMGVAERRVSPDADSRIDIAGVLTDLAGQGITRLMVEGGPGISAAFLKAGLVDTLAWFRAPAVMGGDGRTATDTIGVDDLTQMAAFERIEKITLGDDTLEIYRRRREA